MKIKKIIAYEHLWISIFLIISTIGFVMSNILYKFFYGKINYFCYFKPLALFFEYPSSILLTIFKSFNIISYDLFMRYEILINTLFLAILILLYVLVYIFLRKFILSLHNKLYQKYIWIAIISIVFLLWMLRFVLYCTLI